MIRNVSPVVEGAPAVSVRSTELWLVMGTISVETSCQSPW